MAEQERLLRVEEFDSYEVKAVFSVFIIVLIVFIGGMAQRMAGQNYYDRSRNEYFAEDIFYQNMDFLMTVGQEEDGEFRKNAYHR